MKLITILALLITSACCFEIDKEAERDIFLKCLELAQKQPNTANYNDAAEVVDQCGGVAHRQALSWSCK